MKWRRFTAFLRSRPQDVAAAGALTPGQRISVRVDVADAAQGPVAPDRRRDVDAAGADAVHDGPVVDLAARVLPDDVVVGIAVDVAGAAQRPVAADRRRD